MCPNNADKMANNVDPDQTAPREEQSDLGLHCLLRPVRPKIEEHYGIGRQIDFFSFSHHTEWPDSQPPASQYGGHVRTRETDSFIAINSNTFSSITIK